MTIEINGQCRVKYCTHFFFFEGFPKSCATACDCTTVVVNTEYINPTYIYPIILVGGVGGGFGLNF